MADENRNEKKREKEILEGFLSGAKPQVRLFFEEYGGFIKKAVNSVTIRDRSVTQHDAFMAAVENLLSDNGKSLRRFRGECKLSTYIYTICYRFALAFAKRMNPPEPDPELLHAPESLLEETGEREIRVFNEALLMCNLRERIFIQMVYYDLRSTSEIMSTFGWNSENTVYSQKNKIIAKLRHYAKRLR